MLNLTRSASALRFAVIPAAASLIAAACAAGAAGTASAASGPLDPTLVAQRQLSPQTQPADASAFAGDAESDALKVTVGKSVVITSSPAGEPNLKVLVANTQVSGRGRAKIKVPMGTSSARNSGGFGPLRTEGDSVVYDVESSPGEVKTLSASGGTYKGELPVTVEVRTWLDGKPIEPGDFDNVTGHVKVDYKFTNRTSTPTSLTYKDSNGNLQTTTRDLPLPFGGSFSGVYPPGWADIDAPWANTGITPSGQQLTGTAILFPPLGGIEQTLSMTARVKNASLPPVTVTAVPVDLATEFGGLLFSLGPKAEGLLHPILNDGAWAHGQILQYHQILLRLSQAIARINDGTVKPLVDDIDRVDITQAGLDDVIATTQSDLTEISQVLDGNAAMGAELASAAQQLSALLSSASAPIATVSKAITALQKDLTTAASDLAFAQSELQKLVAATGAPGGVSAYLTTLVNGFASQCDEVGQFVGDWSDADAAAITQAINTGTLSAANVQTLNNLVPAANAEKAVQSTTWGGTLLFVCALLPSQVKGEIATLQELVNKEFPVITAMLAAVDDLIPALQAGLAAAATAVADISAAIPAATQLLNNPNCPSTIQQVLQIKPITSILSQCGLTQVFNAVANLNQFLANEVTGKALPMVTKARGMVPTIVGAVNSAKRGGNEVEKALETAPGTINGYAQELSTAGGLLGTYEDKGISMLDTVAIDEASLAAMQAKVSAGGGVPYGPATGADAVSLGAWQYSLAGSADTARTNVINGGLALLLFVLTAAIGTAMWVRRKPSAGDSVASGKRVP